MEKSIPPFKIGDKVTSDFDPRPGMPEIVRTVIGVVECSNSQSGWLVKADGGEPCACCGRPKASPIVGHLKEGVDSGWFKKVE